MDGIIVVNKEKGVTSHDVVYKVKKLLGEKVGHTGTLDPNATGVLPLLIGDGTKLSKYLVEHDKIYLATIKLGEKTDTADVEGTIIEKKNVDKSLLNEDNIQNILKSFLGKSKQLPPMYSAIKVNGKKLYEYARKGVNVELQPRPIEIFDINLEKIDLDNLTIDFKVHCSKGTYIRSLCEDIAGKINTVGYMMELKRIKVGEFKIESAVTTKELEEFRENKEFINSHFITIENFLKNKEKLELNNKRLELFLNGVKLTCNEQDGVYRIYNNNEFIGSGIVEKNLLKRDIICKK